MYNYMKALHDRFCKPTEEIKQLKDEVHKTHKQLSEQLDETKRRLLLHLLDLEDDLRIQSSEASFVNGMKLGYGIIQEMLPLYDFESEELEESKNTILR